MVIPMRTDGVQPLKGANSYRVDVSDDNGETWTTVHTATKPINKTEYEHKGLKPEEALHFRLFAKKGSDYGLASMPVRDYAGNTDMPSKVRTLVATTQDAGSIKLSWVAPEDDGGADVEQYCILVNQLDEDDDVEGDPVTRDGVSAQRRRRRHSCRERRGCHRRRDHLQPARRTRQHAHQSFQKRCVPGRRWHHDGHVQRLGAGDPLAVRGLRFERCQ